MTKVGESQPISIQSVVENVNNVESDGECDDFEIRLADDDEGKSGDKVKPIFRRTMKNVVSFSIEYKHRVNLGRTSPK
jgi:hypothetical protein